MKHPNPEILALHAGGDLGFVLRWRTRRHLAQCDQCRDEVAAFEATREIIPDLSEIPEIPWNRLAAEMRANIRLGLAAGECVRASEPPLRERRVFTGARAAVALASVIALLVTGLVLEGPGPMIATVNAQESIVQTTANGIQVKKGGQGLRLMNPDTKNVMYSPGAEGGMSARYVDPDTGQVIQNNVYAD